MTLAVVPVSVNDLHSEYVDGGPRSVVAAANPTTTPATTGRGTPYQGA